MIDDCQQRYPRASLRIVTLLAVGGLNEEHPWHPHAVRLVVYVARCLLPRVPAVAGDIVVTVPMTLLMLHEMGVLIEIEEFKDGFVVYQNQAWLDSRLERLNDPNVLDIGLVHFDAEVALWSGPKTTESNEP